MKRAGCSIENYNLRTSIIPSGIFEQGGEGPLKKIEQTKARVSGKFNKVIMRK